MRTYTRVLYRKKTNNAYKQNPTRIKVMKTSQVESFVKRLYANQFILIATIETTYNEYHEFVKAIQEKKALTVK